MQTDESLIEKLVAEFNRILLLDTNNESRQHWIEITADLKAIVCDTHQSVEGNEITFDCKFTKSNNGDIFTAIARGVRNKQDVLDYISNVNPNIFYFHPDSKYELDNFFFLQFVLRKK